MNFQRMYEDQQAFNRQVWDPAGKTTAARIARLKDLSMGMIEEALEFIRTYDFKIHRRQKLRLQNVAHSHEELVDQFKYWLSLCDASDFPIDKLEEMYYAKSRVVQYRFQEEWVQQIDRPSVIVDIDEVLADYITGICEYGKQYGPRLMDLSPSETIRFIHRMNELEDTRGFVDAGTVGQPHLLWQRVKHDFRTKGGKRTLPVFEDAYRFLEFCRAMKWCIILVTSRPVTEYPNLFTDTLWWLENQGLPFDLLWWSNEKAERLEEAAIDFSQVVFAVDDSPKFVQQFRKKGVKTFHLDRRGDRMIEGIGSGSLADPHHVTSLDQLVNQMKKEMADGIRRREA